MFKLKIVVREMPEQIQNEIDRRHRSTVSILAVQLAIVAILLAASWFLAGKFYPFGAPADDASFSIENLTNAGGGNSVTTTLWIAILAIAVSAFLLRRLTFATSVLQDAATIKGASGLLETLQTKTALLASLGLIIAVLGFVISLISGNFLDMLRAGAVASIVLFINFPRKTAWQRFVQAVTK